MKGVHLMQKQSFSSKECAAQLSALSAPERIQIVRFLSEGPHTVSEIAIMLGVPAVNVSHHLNVLFEIGFVERTKQGRHVICSLKLEVQHSKALGNKTLNLGCC